MAAPARSHWITVGSGDLHRSLADGIMNAIEEGVVAERLDGMRVLDSQQLHRTMMDSYGAQMESLRRDLDREKRREQRARSNANATEDDELAANFVRDAEEALRARRRLEKEVDALESRSRTLELPEVFESDSDYVAQAMANLAVCKELAPAEICEALDTILDGFRVDADGRDAVWTTHVLVPAGGAVARLGPISGRIPNRIPATKVLLPDANYPLARQLLDVPDDELKVRDSQWVRRRVVAALEGAGVSRMAARVLSLCAVPEVGDVVCQRLFGHPLPKHIDKSFEQHIVGVFLDPGFVGKPSEYAGDSYTRQALVDHLEQCGGRAKWSDVVTAFEERLGLDYMKVRHASVELDTGKSRVWPAPVVRHGDWGPRGDPGLRHLSLVECGHCDGFATVVVRVPEIVDALLCEHCLRQPVRAGASADIIYPASYLSLRVPT